MNLSLLLPTMSKNKQTCIHPHTNFFRESPGSSKSTCAGLVTGNDSVWGNYGKIIGKPFENDGCLGFNVVYYGLIRMIMGKYWDTNGYSLWE